MTTEIEDEDREAARIPRTKNGRALHHLGSGYAVLLSPSGREVSDRAPGNVWLGFTGTGVRMAKDVIIIFLPDSTDSNGAELTMTSTGECSGVGIGLDGDGIIHIDDVRAVKRQDVRMDWTTMLEYMA